MGSVKLVSFLAITSFAVGGMVRAVVDVEGVGVGLFVDRVSLSDSLVDTVLFLFMATILKRYVMVLRSNVDGEEVRCDYKARCIPSSVCCRLEGEAETIWQQQLNMHDNSRIIHVLPSHNRTLELINIHVHVSSCEVVYPESLFVAIVYTSN